MQTDLTLIEYTILNYISSFDSVEKETLISHFSRKKLNIEQRLIILIQSHLVAEHFTHDRGRAISLNKYSITPHGKIILQNYLISRKEKNSLYRKELIIKILPIIISLIALIKSFWNELIDVWGLIMNCWSGVISVMQSITQ